MIKEILLAAVLVLPVAVSRAESPAAEVKFTLVRQLPLIHARIDGVDATLLLDLGGVEALALRTGDAARDIPGDRNVLAQAGGYPRLRIFLALSGCMDASSGAIALRAMQ